ncbi:MAG: site-specific integrase [Comamonas sp.]|nr:site-specific integrase [Comamonas sp.]
MPFSPSTDAPLPLPAALDGEQVFAHWLLTCGQDPWMPLSPEAAKPYGFIWQSWLRFLVERNDAQLASVEISQRWAHAAPLHVLAFINHGPQSPKRSKPSDITRRRYWRVLDRVYDHGVLHGWAALNPAQGLNAQDMPPSEDPQGVILSPRMWRALERQLPSPDDLISTRDRAVLMLLMELGLTPEEVRQLEMDNLQWDIEQPTRLAALQVVGERDRQSRTLPLSNKLDGALRQWLQARAGYHAMQGQPTLFCTRKAPVLSKHTLLHLVTKTLQQAAQASKLTAPLRMGPQVIRNTVLVQWLDSGCTVDEVLERSGMKHPNALLHLRAYFSEFKDDKA